MSSPQTIVLKCDALSERAEEARAGGTITPGDLLTINSAGAVIRNATAGLATPVYVAKEDTFQGRTIDNDYASTELVFYHIAQPGDELYCWVAAAAAAIVIGDKLTSDGAGGWKKAGAASQLGSGTFAYTAADAVMGTAVEALDNSGGGARARLRVRVR